MADRPNILLITCDQLQAFATGCYDNPDVRTPHIDALAASGLRARTAVSNAPVCMAARSVLLSGRPNRRCTGGVSNVSYPCGKRGSYPMPEYPPPERLHFPDPTLPERLRDAGYLTAALGKWHMYAWPDAIGFDHYVIPRTHHVHSAQGYVEDGGREFVPEGWSVEFETARAERFLREADADRPFFLYLNYSPPHPPLDDAPEEFLRMYDPSALTLRDNVDEENFFPSEHDVRVYLWDYRYYELQLPYTLRPLDVGIRDLTALYYGNVSWLDAQIGRVMRALEETGRREDTLVVFVSDHGDNLGSHGRNGKGLPYDESLRIPMILSRPGALEAGRIDGVPSLIDLAPTLLTAAGVDVPDSMDGTDLSRGAPDTAVSEIFPGRLVARSERFTAQIDLTGPRPRREVFFNNVEDPFQMRNLAGTDAFPHEQNRLFSRLESFHRDTPILPAPDYGFV